MYTIFENFTPPQRMSELWFQRKVDDSRSFSEVENRGGYVIIEQNVTQCFFFVFFSANVLIRRRPVTTR
jgi:hypothetical protein